MKARILQCIYIQHSEFVKLFSKYKSGKVDSLVQVFSKYKSQKADNFVQLFSKYKS